MLYERLDEVKGRVLVTNGKRNVLIGSQISLCCSSSWGIMDARLHFYPDLRHGNLFQGVLEYVRELDMFFWGCGDA